MQFLYNISIRFYGFIIRIAALFNSKAKLWIKGRKNLIEKAPQNSHGKEKINWVHCASLGEFEQGRPLIEELKKKFPSEKILLTFYSPSGYEIRKNYELADWVTYLPLDTKNEMQDFIAKVKPYRVFIIKYELWFNMLQILGKQNIKTYLVSGKFREKQLFFKPLGKWFLNILSNSFTHFFVQDEASKKVLQNAKINKVEICGDTRIDRVIALAQKPLQFEHLKNILANKKVVIAGSTWQQEIEILTQLQHHFSDDTVLIIAPHEVKEENIQLLQNKFQNSVLWSNIEKTANAKIIIINCIGVLSSLYQYAHVAIIGGGFNAGIHNILEPACFGLPVFFGPKHHKFDEATAMIQQQSGFSFSSLVDLEKTLLEILESEQKRNEIRDKQLHYLQQQSGATKKIMSLI